MFEIELMMLKSYKIIQYERRSWLCTDMSSI